MTPAKQALLDALTVERHTTWNPHQPQPAPDPTAQRRLVLDQQPPRRRTAA